MFRRFLISLILTLSLLSLGAESLEGKSSVMLSYSPSAVRNVDWGKLMSGNTALWLKKKRLYDAETQDFFSAWSPSLLRIPGGSWSDEFFWNGNGVRDGERLDSSRYKDGKWDIDYSGYKKGFRVTKQYGEFSGYHGSLDIKQLHEFNEENGVGTIATVNAGSATAEDAAQWVKWAKNQGYSVNYWEVGNELEGDWEVGHIRPDGSKMSAEQYAEIFLEFISAIKAVDPEAKVGGPVCSNATLPFVEVLIQKAGHVIDFVSFHTYPVEGQVSQAERYRKASVEKPVEQIRAWIKQYHPKREREIEIGITEWHVQVAETAPTVDLSSGLWSALFLKSLAEEGVDFACQWDMYSTSKSGAGGHGFLDNKEGQGLRAQGQVFKLLRNTLGSEIFKVEGQTETLKCLATRKEGKLALLFINVSDEHVDLGLDTDSIPRGNVSQHVFSQREYFWNTVSGKPEWSYAATVTHATGREAIQSGIPAHSLVLLTEEEFKETTPSSAFNPVVKVHLPERAETSFPIQGVITIQDASDGRPSPEQMEVLLTTSKGTLSADKVNILNGVGLFSLTAGEVGQSLITATLKDQSVEHEIDLYKPKEKSVVVWDYENNPEKHLKESVTSYSLKVAKEAIPNSSLLAVVLQNAKAENMANTLIQPKSLNLRFEKRRIRGVTLTIGKSADFKAPEGASLSVVLQSEVNHWIPLRNIPFQELQTPGHEDFSPLEMTLPFSAKDQLDAMSQLYNVVLSLNTSAPVNGTLYLKSLGFVVEEE